MKNLSEFDGVLFDLDGVITDTATFHFMAWKQLADELDIPFSEQDNEQLKGVDRISSLRHILSLGNRSLPEGELYDLAQKKNTYYRALINDISDKDILPGVINLLLELQRKKIKTAIASASQNARTIIQGLGLNGYFDFIADASLARSKPAPDIFLFAAYGLGLHSSRCIGIEDSLAGLQAIKSASMYAVGVGQDNLNEQADVVVEDLHSLRC